MKRRGLAIATAVAVASSGIVGVNYVSAKELGDRSHAMNLSELAKGHGDNQADGAINGPVENVDGTSAEKENSNPSISAVEYFTRHESDIVSNLRPANIAEAPGADVVVNQFLTQAKSDGIAVDSAWESEFRKLVEARERAVLPEFYSPSAQDYFDHYAPDIAAALRPNDDALAMNADAVVAHYVAQAKANDVDVDPAWESQFRVLVQEKEKALYPEYFQLPAPRDYFETHENSIGAGLRGPKGAPRVSVDEIVDNYAAELERSFDFGGEQAKTAWKSEFRKLVEAKERALYPEYYVADAAEYFEHAESLIAADLRPADGSDGLGVDAVVDKYANEVKGKGLDFGAANDEAAWKSEFRKLVEAKQSAILAENKRDALVRLEDSGVNAEQKKVFRKAIEDVQSLAALGALLKSVDAEIANPVPNARPKPEPQPKPEVPAGENEAGVDEIPESPLVGQVLEAAKKRAWSYVHESEYLSAEQKTKFESDIQAAADLKSVEETYSEVIQAESETDLVEAKRAAVAAIEGSEFLSDAQKAAFVGAVEAASSVRQVEGLVDGALDAADLQQESVEAGAHRAVLDNELGVNSNPVVDPNKESLAAEDLAAPFAQHRDEVLAQDLVEAKRAAVAAIEGADHLTEEQKSQFKNRINDSASITAVTAVIDEAHKLADKQAAEESDKAALAEEKSQAHRIIDGLSKLSPRQKAEFKEQVDGANTGAYVAHIVERAQAMNEQHKPADDTDAQEPGKPGNNETPGNPGSDNKPGQDQKPGNTTDAFKGFFGLAAGLGVFALIFGGILHIINNFDGFGVVQEHVRNAFAKIGIRF